MAAKTVISAKTGTSASLLRGEGRRTATPIGDIGIEELYHSLVDRLEQMVFRKDLGGRFVFVNERFCAWLGMDRGEILGKTDQDLFPDLAARLRDDDQHAMESNRDTTAVYSFPHCVGPVEIRRLPLRDGRGAVIGLHGLISEQDGGDEANTSLLGRLLEAIPENVYFTDADGRFTHMSQQMAGWLGLESVVTAGRGDLPLHLPPAVG